MAKKNLKRRWFAEGGDVDDTDDEGYGTKLTRTESSQDYGKEAFRKAYASAKANGQSDFKWKRANGDDYTVAVKDASPKKDMDEVTVSAKRPEKMNLKEQFTDTNRKYGPASDVENSLRDPAYAEQRKKDKAVERKQMDDRLANDLVANSGLASIGQAGTALATSGMGRAAALGKAARAERAIEEGKKAAEFAKEAGRKSTNLRSKLTRSMNQDNKLGARDSALDDKKVKDLEEVYSRYKKGGSVKKYARGGGIESKGKTRGRFV
jgi:hypothetical protein